MCSFFQAYSHQLILQLTSDLFLHKYMIVGALFSLDPYTDAFGEQGRPSIGNEAAVPPDATLYVSIQLMSWKTAIHVGEGRTILKKTLRKGKSKEKQVEIQTVVGGIFSFNTHLYKNKFISVVYIQFRYRGLILVDPVLQWQFG